MSKVAEQVPDSPLRDAVAGLRRTPGFRVLLRVAADASVVAGLRIAAKSIDKVERYAAAMHAGEFGLAPSPIEVWGERVLGGNHRCQCLARYGATLRAVFVYTPHGVPQTLAVERLIERLRPALEAATHDVDLTAELFAYYEQQIARDDVMREHLRRRGQLVEPHVRRRQA